MNTESELTCRFSPEVITAMRRHIVLADGNEVFFAGMINEHGVVTSVTVAARGQEDAVPVNVSQARECAVLIHNHPSGVLRPSDADMGIASTVSQDGQGFYIINNEVTAVYAVMEPVKPRQIVPLQLSSVRSYLSSGGPLSKLSPHFEERPAQLDLLEAVADVFNKKAVGMFEAGTGVGKSYAYLLPAMLWAIQNKERVVVSTGTINLQQQLIEKDIPAAERILAKPVKAVLVKGRQNYICLRRLQDASSEPDLFTDDSEVLASIKKWIESTPTGSRSDLPFVPPENVWSRINSESDACMGARCIHRENCFVMKVRKEAAGANLLIVNHHLLFADIESRMDGVGYDDASVLPPYKHIVFDEAHGIESAATSFFSGSFTRFRLLKQLSLLYRQRRGGVAGYIFTLQVLSKTEDKTEDIIVAINEIKQTIINLELLCNDVLGSETAIWLNDNTVRVFSPVLSLLNTLSEKIAAVVANVREIMEGIDEEDKDVPHYWETKSVLRRLDDVVLLCNNFSAWNEKKDIVFWMQRLRLNPALTKNNENPIYIQFIETPLDVAGLMNKGVYEPMESIVCTSATLSINNSFTYWMKRAGIQYVDAERLKQKMFPSPFPYEKNVLFCVPQDAPFPDQDSIVFQQYVESAIIKLITAAQGRTLVLFTSYESLKSACVVARNAFQNKGIQILKQGDDDRFRLLDIFKKDTNSVLFATDSFWQGVDVPGNSLSQVVIVKLPFSVPNDPVYSARAEAITQRGGSPFMELSLPEAVIKFRQGFGRLVRRGDDKGCVVVLDRRIMERKYGSLFMNSIPKTKCLYAPLSSISKSIETFLYP
ncbi:MAG: helicase [Treponema sp.]|nr:helicase [Treponema sp.]